MTDHDGAELLRTAGNGYLLDTPADSVDAHRFLELAGTGAELAATDPARAIDTLEAALALWRGPALLDTYEGMRCRIQAAHLEERRITAYEDLTAARLSVDAARVPVSELRQLAAEHSGRERLSELLMLALYRDGRQAEALEVFHARAAASSATSASNPAAPSTTPTRRSSGRTRDARRAAPRPRALGPRTGLILLARPAAPRRRHGRCQSPVSVAISRGRPPGTTAGAGTHGGQVNVELRHARVG